MKAIIRSALVTVIRSAVVGGIASLVLASTAASSSFLHKDLQIEVRGEGPAMLFLPGLNSAASTWHESCDALPVQCHLVQLPGFAGLSAVEEEPWLDTMTERLLDYVDSAGLEQPVVVGHSLGGLLAMKAALAAPKRFSKLVIVDSLPFFPAAQNVQATSEMMQPMAASMRMGMRNMPPEQYREQARMSMQGMTRDQDRLKLLAEWSDSSDRWTTSQAMYELMTVDLRTAIGDISTPTLVVGAWAGFASFGATRESVTATFEAQYAELKDLRIEVSEDGLHFLMWDDPQWLQQQISDFVGLK